MYFANSRGFALSVKGVWKSPRMPRKVTLIL